MHDDLIDSLRYCAFIQGRSCGKTALARQLLNSNYGLASADNWAERYLYTTDKLYDTLGIKDYLNKVYGDPMTAKRSKSLKELAKEYDHDSDLIIKWFENINFKEEEKNKMADQKQEYIFVIKNTRGDRYEVTIEKDFRRRDYLYHVNVCYLKNAGEKRFASSFYYHCWEQVETQLMYDLKNIGCTVQEDCKDIVTQELMHAKHRFGGCLYSNFDSPYQGGIIPEIMEFRNGKELTLRKAKPFEVMPKIEKVIFNPPATIVKWKDGTKTVVKCQDDDEFDWEKGLAMAYVKRAFNNERTYYGLFKKNEPLMNLPNSNVKYDPNEVKKLELFVPKDVVITEKGLHDAVDALTKACDDKIDEMLGDIDISKEMEFIETGKWPENNMSVDQSTIKEVKRYSDVPDTSSVDAEGSLMPL